MNEGAPGKNQYSEIYPKHKSSPDKLKATEQIVKSLAVPLVQIDYNPYFIGEKSEEVKKNDFCIQLKYDCASQSGTERYKNHFPHPRGCFYLKEFNLTRILNQGKEEKEISIGLENIAPGCKVFFDPMGRYSTAIIQESLVYVGDKDIISPCGILIMAHEAGHVVEYRAGSRSERLRKLDIYERKKKPKSLTSEERGIIIQSERNAWAVGLKNLKDFIGTSSKPGGICSIDEARQLIHDYCLASYHDVFVADEVSAGVEIDSTE